MGVGRVGRSEGWLGSGRAEAVALAPAAEVVSLADGIATADGAQADGGLGLLAGPPLSGLRCGAKGREKVTGAVDDWHVDLPEMYGWKNAQGLNPERRARTDPRRSRCNRGLEPWREPGDRRGCLSSHPLSPITPQKGLAPRIAGPFVVTVPRQPRIRTKRILRHVCRPPIPAGSARRSHGCPTGGYVSAVPGGSSLAPIGDGRGFSCRRSRHNCFRRQSGSGFPNHFAGLSDLVAYRHRCFRRNFHTLSAKQRVTICIAIAAAAVLAVCRHMRSIPQRLSRFPRVFAGLADLDAWQRLPPRPPARSLRSSKYRLS
jgi:hypothetical protein